MGKPNCYNSKGERGIGPDFDPLARYRRIAEGIYEWSGLPKDCPEGYIERALFDYGAVGAKEVKGMGICVMPASAVARGIYGNPLSWTPAGIIVPAGAPEDLLKEDDSPVLWIGDSIAKLAKPFAQIITDSLISWQQNVIAMRHLVALDGSPGGTANGILLEEEIVDGQQFLPILDLKRLNLQVIDLKVKDWTQSLIGSYNAADNEILSLINVKNTGTEKASGVTLAETTSLHQELAVSSDIGLKKRLQWCDANGFGFDVKISDAYSVEQPAEANEPGPAQDGDNNDGNPTE